MNNIGDWLELSGFTFDLTYVAAEYGQGYGDGQISTVIIGIRTVLSRTVLSLFFFRVNPAEICHQDQIVTHADGMYAAS